MKITIEEAKKLVHNGEAEFIDDEVLENVLLADGILEDTRRKKKEIVIDFDPFDFSPNAVDNISEEMQEQLILRDAIGIFDTENCRVKVIEYGDTVELITSFNGASRNNFKDIKNLPGNRYEDTKTHKIYDKQKHEKREESPCEFMKSVETLRRLIELNFSKKDGYFITLGYDYNMPTVIKAQEDYQKFYNKFSYYYGRRTGSKLLYLKVLEPTKQGSWHIHLLIRAEDGKNLEISKEQILKMRKHKNIEVFPIAEIDESNIAVLYSPNRYLPFYKSSTKLFTCSQELERPIKKTLTNAEGKEMVAGYNKLNDYTANFTLGRGRSNHIVNIVRYQTFKKA